MIHRLRRRPAPRAPWIAALLVAVLLVPLASPAFADEPTSAATWKQRGDEAMDAGRAAEALAAYRKAAELEPSASLEYNVGRALLAVGDFAGALDAFEHYDASAPEELKAKTHRLADVMSELRAKVSTVTITGDPESTTSARVTLRGRDVGVFPLAALRVNAGRAELRVARDGYLPFVETLDLPAGGTSRVHVTLSRERIVAHLAIVASPPSTTITIDGEPRGPAPIDLELAPGPHRIVLGAPKHDSRSLSLSLARDESRRLDVELLPSSPPLTSRWWFWTGLGVVVAGATAGIIAANVERSPTQGSLGTFRAP